MNDPIQVLIWNEYLHEKTRNDVAAHYPHGLHEAIAAPLRGSTDLTVQTATLGQPDHGLPKAVLTRTDVLVWWGHMAHDEIADAVVDAIQQRVLEGMGLIVLHSGHHAKIFKRLMGTPCDLKWREASDKERIWNVMPSHPICQGIGEYFELPAEEMYGEPFTIPVPDELLFISWFTGGEVFRSGATWLRGHGRIFYFRPGHETFPTYHHPMVQRVIANAVRWCRPRIRQPSCSVNSSALEPLPPASN
jgi:trehalose utilization protein